MGPDNVIISPHASALTVEMWEGRREIFKENLRRFLANEPFHVRLRQERRVLRWTCAMIEVRDARDRVDTRYTSQKSVGSTYVRGIRKCGSIRTRYWM